MMAKLTTLLHSKVAAAVLGVLLVGGSGGAVAVAATQGHLNGIGLQMVTGHSDSTESPDENNHAHAEGLLTACDATAGTITVADEKGPVTFIVNSDTKFNGDDRDNDSEKGGATTGGATTGKSTGESTGESTGATTGATTGESTSESTGEKGGSSTASTPAFTLTDLCALVGKVKVQVQATTSTSGSTTTNTATKVTVEGPGTATAGGDTSESHGQPTGVGTPDDHSSTGGDSSIGGASTGH